MRDCCNCRHYDRPELINRAHEAIKSSNGAMRDRRLSYVAEEANTEGKLIAIMGLIHVPLTFITICH